MKKELFNEELQEELAGSARIGIFVTQETRTKNIVSVSWEEARKKIQELSWNRTREDWRDLQIGGKKDGG